MSESSTFLLSKSARYWYDADAVREAGKGRGPSERFRGDLYTNNRSFYNSDRRATDRGSGNSINDGTGRNIRNVWTFATEPSPRDHFASFPKELARRCILAGCPEGGTVLDPFGGTGTVGLVAREARRDAVLIEVSEAYVAQATARLRAALVDVEGDVAPQPAAGPLFEAIGG